MSKRRLLEDPLGIRTTLMKLHRGGSSGCTVTLTVPLPVHWRPRTTGFFGTPGMVAAVAEVDPARRRKVLDLALTMPAVFVA
jgi:hypothetical protein